MNELGYGRSPRICVDNNGIYWAAWISWHGEGECIRISWREKDSEWSTPIVCSENRPWVTGIALTSWKDGVLVGWIDGDNPDTDGLKIRFYNTKESGDIRLVSPLRRGPAELSMAASNSQYALVWTVKRVGGRQLMICLEQDTEKREDQIEIYPENGSCIRPVLAYSKEGAVVVWSVFSKGSSKILAQFIGSGKGDLQQPIEIASDSSGILAMPSACMAQDGGVWVAWQSDLDPSVGPGLVRWIELAHLGEKGIVSEPADAMPGVCRQGDGEDQGFEAPCLSVMSDGSLVIVGRGSQSVCRQDLGAKGWSERENIDERGWQCRGHKLCTCKAGDGVLVAGREKDGIVVKWLPSGQATGGGEPQLTSRNKSKIPQVETSILANHQHIIAGKRVLFGDIHQHTMASDGTGTIEETFHRARYRYRDNVVAVADHESFVGKRTPPGEWKEACRIADEFYRPGTFVTLKAFEWTQKMYPGPGHKVVYLPPEGGPVLSREHELTETSKGLISKCGKLGAISVPHHVGWTGADMNAHDPQIQPCFEMVSCHGAYERPGFAPIGTRGDDKKGQFIADALDMGLRFGFVGGSDGHGLNWHHGVCRVKDSHRSGLTGIFATELSREGVLEAISQRLCYATSGAKIGLWFEIDGRPMGEELVIGSPVPFRVVVAATDFIEELSLVSNSGREIELDAFGNEADVHGTLPPPLESGWCYYFVRVIQKDKEVAWSSPIWMNAPDIA